MSLNYKILYKDQPIMLLVDEDWITTKDRFDSEREARDTIDAAIQIMKKGWFSKAIDKTMAIQRDLSVWGERYIIKYGRIGAVALEDKAGNWTATNTLFMDRADAQVVIDKAMICHGNGRPINVEFNRNQLFAEVEYVKLD